MGETQEASSPRIAGPESYMRTNSIGPQFVVWVGSNPYYAVEVATDYRLFDAAQNEIGRTPHNFFATWDSSPDLLEASGDSDVFYLPQDVWKRLRPAAQLFYAVRTSSSKTGWQNLRSSLQDNGAVVAPSIRLQGTHVNLPDRLYRPEEDLWRNDPP